MDVTSQPCPYQPLGLMCTKPYGHLGVGGPHLFEAEAVVIDKTLTDLEAQTTTKLKAKVLSVFDDE